VNGGPGLDGPASLPPEPLPAPPQPPAAASNLTAEPPLRRAVNQIQSLGGLPVVDPQRPLLEALAQPLSPTRPAGEPEIFYGGTARWILRSGDASVHHLGVESVVFQDTLYMTLSVGTPERPGEAQAVAFSARQVDGSALPEWLVLNAQTGDIFGKPPVDAEEISLRFQVRLEDGWEGSRDVRIDARTGAIVDPNAESEAAGAVASGATSFGEQIRREANRFADGLARLVRSLTE